MSWLLDPVTRQPLPPIPGMVMRSRDTASHWLIERDETGIPVRMRFRFCDEPKCCPPFEPRTRP